MTNSSPRTRELEASYIYNVNAALGEGRERLANELAADLEEVLAENGETRTASVTPLRRPSRIRTALNRADRWTLATYNPPFVPSQRRSTEDGPTAKH